MAYLVAKTTIEESTGLVTTTGAGHMALHNDKAKAVNSLTEEMIDARNPELATPAETATSVPDLLGQLKEMLKNITGETNWYNNVSTTLSNILSKFRIEHSSAGVHTGSMLKEVRIYTSNTTWTKPSGLKFVIVKARGGGSGGGGTGTAAGTGAAGGGAQGGFSMSKIAAGSLGSSEVVTIGSGGAGGVGDSTGSAGADTSLGSLVIAKGANTGGNGSDGNESDRAGGGNTNLGTGDFTIYGSPGGIPTSGTTPQISGWGGGEGGHRGRGADANGDVGVLGGGGSGAYSTGTSAHNGGAGGNGYVIVEEYF